MTARRSHCDGDRIHSVWERTCAASSAAFSSACRTRTMAELQSPARASPSLGGPKGSKNPLAIMSASHAHRNLVREMGPECRCAVRNATATRFGSVRATGGVCDGVVQPAASRNARHDCMSELVLARAPMRVHVAAYTTLPPDHLGEFSEGGSPSTHSTRSAFLRSREQKLRRLLHAAAGLSKCVGDRRRRHRRENLSELCECLRTRTQPVPC
jgi:hypothetical protein